MVAAKRAALGKGGRALLANAEGLIESYLFDFKWYLKMTLTCLDLFLDPKPIRVS